mmetsp:Transcript_4561/g.8791  ORF Transcript_4561/g.8791 Transcript_4561/m.8791 type:complete len:1034 (-) Transcript_4561:58-3159(-)
MASKYKVIFLIILTGVALILSSAIFALEFMLQKRKHLLKILKAQAQESTTAGTASSFSTISGSSSSSSSIKSKNDKNQWYQTIKNSSPLSPSDQIQHMQHDVANDRILSADAHLSLALSAFPFEQYDNAIPAKLYHSETLPSRGMKFVKEDDHDNGGGGGGSGKVEYNDENYQQQQKQQQQQQHSDIHSYIPTQQEAIYHLEQSAQLGNPYAQNMLANILASGILPIQDNVSSLQNNSNQTRGHRGHSSSLVVPSDFASGGQQLARALVLWHMSAMGGNIEAAMALGYRHYISATSGDDSTLFVEEEIQDGSLGPSSSHQISGSTISSSSSYPEKYPKASRDNQKNTGEKVRMKHNPDGSAHYGVLGTCQTSLAYYEAAANGIMDEMESGPLRGKVLPARDQHKLAEIHQRGASSKLGQYNKPDELEEAIKYYKIRANNIHNPDLAAAHKLAEMYHYGIRGVKQDMKEALKYYEIAADRNSWEAAGQAGKFHLWGMGLEGEERNLKKALDYFEMGTPGGLNACKLRFQKKLTMKQRNVDDDLWNTGEMTYNCDHPSVNGMGLLHLYGIPMMIATNLTEAIEYFELAKNMGNMDAYFNLAMMRLGWMNPFFGTSFDYAEGKKLDGPFHKTSPTTKDYIEALNLLKKAESMGHIQAKHRLAMMYAHGVENNGTIIVAKSCPRALKLNREIAMIGTTISKQLRAAYKQYMAGNYDASLRNYLAAAETGSVEAQVNAAFLLEQGHCLGMNRLDCMKASVRMWRAAARQGDEEASLRVGDFYYYGRLREDVVLGDVLNGVTFRDIDFSTAPFPWIRYILYPEDLLPKAKKYIVKIVKWGLSKVGSGRHSTTTTVTKEKDDYDYSNPEHKKQAVCRRKENLTYDKDAIRQEHFQIAADYYKKAAAKHGSARANFNLGFMHEWGLGLSQDFPLAKRFYDIAATSKNGEGELAVQIALFCMNIHEFFVKATVAIKKWYDSRRKTDQSDIRYYAPGISFEDSSTTVRDIVLHHVFAADSLLIVILVFLLIGLIQNRQDRHHR